MVIQLRHALSKLSLLSKRFASDKAANISILFGFSCVVIMIAVGSGIDLGRAYFAKQRLAETATLACQYASRPSIIDTSTASYSGSNGGTSYTSSVTSFISSTLQSQHFQYTQSNSAPFSYTQNGPANVTLTASVPTTFLQIIRVTQVPVSATSHCYDTASNINQTVPNGNTPFAVNEGFEASGCSGSCYMFYSDTGQAGQTVATPNSTPSSTIGYTGSNGTQWVIMGYCLEVDSAGIILSNVPQGTHSAELDCDNGSGSAGNSSISTKTYLAAGNYELRYNFASRVDYADYDPVYLCGSSASDLSWANDTNASDGGASNVLRTNQINAYLDLNTNGVPPTHQTIDGTQSLGGSNLIDICVYSSGWIERSVRIKVTTPGYYWLSFAADGQNDSYGGQIDNIRLCLETCTTTLQDNFPSSWLAANNGGVNKVLFEDTFESPSYANGSQISYVGNPGSSDGTNTGLGSGGWPSQTAKGWSGAPYNQIDYILAYTTQGLQSIQLDGANSGSMTTTNRLISRPFILDPGYYQLTYDYVADVIFSSLGSTVYCGATPSAANVTSLTGSQTGTARGVGYSLGTMALNTNIVTVFMSHSLMASTPNLSTTLNSTSNYVNPDGTTTTSPKVAPDAVSLTSYNSAQVNPLLDICGYASGWQARTSNILIQKPGTYWLTFSSSNGAADGYGGSIDDVKLTALGSPYMSSPPSTYVTIPVPNPQPNGLVTYAGFEIVADPLTPPAAPQ